MIATHRSAAAPLSILLVLLVGCGGASEPDAAPDPPAASDQDETVDDVDEVEEPSIVDQDEAMGSTAAPDTADVPDPDVPADGDDAPSEPERDDRPEPDEEPKTDVEPEPDDSSEPAPSRTGEFAGVLTEEDTGTTTVLRVGDHLALRLSNDWVWGRPRGDGEAVMVSPVQYESDPGFTEWQLTAQREGQADIAVDGEPNCAQVDDCPARTVRVSVEVDG